VKVSLLNLVDRVLGMKILNIYLIVYFTVWLLGLYLSWESFSLIHGNIFTYHLSYASYIMFFFHIHYSYYTKANLSD